MRTSILLLCFWSVFTAIISAQVSVGFSSGVNLGWQEKSITGVDIPTTLFRNMLHVEGRTRLNKQLSIGFEAGLSGQSTQSTAESFGCFSSSMIRNNMRFQFFEMSTILKYRLLRAKTRPYILAAASSGFVLSSKKEMFDVWSSDSFDPTITTLSTSEYSRRNTFLSGGFGVERGFKKGGLLFAECRYQHGLIDVTKPNTTAAHFRSASLTVGYAYQFGKKKMTDNLLTENTRLN
jgi:hypothetical protein